MADWTLYRIANGEIVGHMSGETGGIGADGCLTMAGRWDGAVWYVADGFRVERPTMPLASASLTGGPGDTITITGAPAGTRLSIDGGVDFVVDDPLAFGLYEAGIYRLAFSCWPYLPAVREVTCT